MAKITNNSLVASLSGKFGGLFVFRQMKDGRIIVSAMPDFGDREFSEKQIATQERLKEASVYASAAAKAEPVYAELGRPRGRSAYQMALSDWYSVPVVHEVIRSEECIRVFATDKVQVDRVLITISDEQGQTLEKGEAVLAGDAWWEYAAAVPAGGKLLVEAFDLPGNVARYEG